MRRGYQLDTWDLVPPGRAEILWFIDLPRTRRDWHAAKEQFPNAKTVLMACESPLVCPQMFNKKNRVFFDHIVSYEQADDSTGFTSYRLPVPVAEPLDGPKFSERRLLCMVNSNRVDGMWAVRQSGWEGLPGIGRLLNGWHFGLEDLKRVVSADLYIERRRIAREADQQAALEIDFFGKGWKGQPISWCPLYPNPPYRCSAGSFVEDRIATLSGYRFSLAYENWRGRLDYVTDRLFDGFLAGTVPVYLGDVSIGDVIPRECFVDAREFPDRNQLLLHLSSMPESRWKVMVIAGREFMGSSAINAFREESFAEKMTQVLEQVGG